MKPTSSIRTSLFPSLQEQRSPSTRPFASSHSQYDTDEGTAIINSPLPSFAGSSTSVMPLIINPPLVRNPAVHATPRPSIRPVTLTTNVDRTYKHLEQISPDSAIFSPAAYAEQAIRNQDITAFSRVDLKSLDSTQIQNIAIILLKQINSTKVYNTALLDMAVKMSEIFKFPDNSARNIAFYAAKVDDMDTIEYFTSQLKNAMYDHIARLALENGHTQLAIIYTQKYMSRRMAKYDEDFQTNFEEVEYLKDTIYEIEKQKIKSITMKSILNQLRKLLDEKKDPRESRDDIIDGITVTLEDQFYDNELNILGQISDAADEWLEAIDEAGIPLGQYQGEFQWEANRLWKILDTINPDSVTTSPAMANLITDLGGLRKSGYDPRVFDVIGLLDINYNGQLRDGEKTYILNIRDNFENWISSIDAFEENQHDEVTEQLHKELIELAIKKDNLGYVRSQLASRTVQGKEQIDFLFQAAEYSDSIYQYLKEKYNYHYVTLDKTLGLQAIVKDDKFKLLDVINRLNRRTALDEWTFRSYHIAAAKLDDSALFILLQRYTNQKDLSYLNNAKVSPAVMKYLIDTRSIRSTLNYQILTNNLSPAIIGYFLKDPKNQTRLIYNSLLSQSIYRDDFNSTDFLLSIAPTLKIQPDSKIQSTLIHHSSLLENHPDLLQKFINISTRPLQFQFDTLQRLIVLRANRSVFIILLKERLRGRVIISDENIDRITKDLQQRGYRELAQLPRKIEMEYLKTGARM